MYCEILVSNIMILQEYFLQIKSLKVKKQYISTHNQTVTSDNFDFDMYPLDTLRLTTYLEIKKFGDIKIHITLKYFAHGLKPCDLHS